MMRANTQHDAIELISYLRNHPEGTTRTGLLAVLGLSRSRFKTVLEAAKQVARAELDGEIHDAVRKDGYRYRFTAEWLNSNVALAAIADSVDNRLKHQRTRSINTQGQLGTARKSTDLRTRNGRTIVAIEKMIAGHDAMLELACEVLRTP